MKCKMIWAYWYGFTHAFQKLDVVDMRMYIKLKCYKERLDESMQRTTRTVQRHGLLSSLNGWSIDIFKDKFYRRMR